MEEDFDDVPLWVPVTKVVHQHHTVYGTRGQDVSVTYWNTKKELIVFDLWEDELKIADGEMLADMPTGDRQLGVEADELWAIITALANIEAAHPIFEDFFLSLREFWKTIEHFQRTIVPATLGPVVSASRETFRMLLPDDPAFDERVIKMMIAITDFYGTYDRVFKRYVVIGDEPITTHDINEAVLEKIQRGGKLIDLRAG